MQLDDTGAMSIQQLTDEEQLTLFPSGMGQIDPLSWFFVCCTFVNWPSITKFGDFS